MKTVSIFCGALLLFSLALQNTYAQQQAYPYYVVIGAFASEQHAVNFVATVSKKYPAVKMKLNVSRNLFYVFTQSTSDKKAAFAEAKRFQLGEFGDAWVYNGPLEGDALVSTIKAAGDLNPESGERKAGISLGDKVSINNTDQPETKPVDSAMERIEAHPTEVTDTKPNKDKFYFAVYRATDHAPIDGEVTEVDVDRSRKVASVESNKYVPLPSPNNRTGRVLLVCDVFGYRQAQEALEYKNPTGFDRDSTGALVVPFELVRLRKGDVSVMYRVLFYKDASIMQPGAEYELQSLLQMMKENPHYKIRIHGHTNGNKGGKIISRPEGGSFFSLTGAKEGSGSSKKLSQRRAETVRDYLKENGIADSRMEIKAWGGKLPLYDKTSARADENVRVEIEILQD